MSFTLAPIGVVRSPMLEEVDAEWGGVVANIVVEPRWEAGLQGLDQFSHALVLFYMHKATFAASDDLVRHPRGRADLPLAGIFAQRAKHRPNPIGVTVVEIMGLSGNVLSVRGLDAIDGTPVLDLKPYMPQFDRAEGARLPAWVSEIMAGYF